MKIVLCMVQRYPDMQEVFRRYGIVAPIGLGYIASFLLRQGHDVKIFDDAIMTSPQFRAEIEEYRPDLVGFFTYTYAIESCLAWAGIIKGIDPTIRTVFGGPHPTHLPRETLAHRDVDFVCVGEGEETMTELAGALARRQRPDGIKGLMFKDEGGGIVDNGPRPFIKDLDTLPFPAYHLLRLDRYRSNPTRRFTTMRFATISTLRGCSYRCLFCSQMFGQQVRFRSPESVVSELEFLAQHYGIGELRFLDDDFTIDPERAIAVCDLMVRRGLKLIWNCNSKVTSASRPLFQAMRRAGCRGVLIGVESGVQEMLDVMQKDITLEQIEKGVALAKEIIGFVNCTFLFGMPGDTVERVRRTIAFAKKLDPDFAYFSIAHPIPGSQLFHEALGMGFFDKESVAWEGFTIMLNSKVPVVAQMSTISPKELVRLRKRAFREFYLRPRCILNLFVKCNIILILNLYLYIEGVGLLLGYQLRRFKLLFQR